MASLILAATLSLGGCGDDPLRPIRRADEDTGLDVRSVPLALGSRWTYRLDYTNEWFSDSDIDLPPPVRLQADGTRALAAIETLDGRDYVVEHEQVVGNGGPPTDRWRRYRQDAAGLYRADVPLTVPPWGVDGGEAVDDLTRLVFPLEVGSSWTLQPGDSSVFVTVEAVDTLSLAIGEVPAFRLCIDVATDRDGSYRLLWYGAAGMLRREDHFEVVAVDGLTGATVRIVSHEVEELTGLELPE